MYLLDNWKPNTLFIGGTTLCAFAQPARTPRFTKGFLMSTYWCPDEAWNITLVKIPEPFKKGSPNDIYIYIYNTEYIYIYIYSHWFMIPHGTINVTLGGWRLPKIYRIPSGTAICCVVSVRVFRQWEHAKYWYCLRLMQFLRLSKTVPKSPFEAYLEDILQNLRCCEPSTDTSTNRKIWKENRTPK